MKRVSCLSFALFVVCLTSQVQAINLLQNGELTTPSGNNEAADFWNKSEPTLDGLGNPIDSFRFQKAGFADAADDNLGATPNPGPDGNTATNDLGGMWFRGFLGNNASNPGILVDASAWQDVAANPNQPYTLKFFEKHEFYFQAAAAGVSMQYYSGGGGGTLLGSDTFDLLATPGTNTDPAFLEPWFERALVGTTPAGTDTIRVLAFMEDGSDNPTVVTFKPQGLLLDRFSLVPEPTSALLLGGLGMFGALGYRRR